MIQEFLLDPCCVLVLVQGLSDGSDGKESARNAGDLGSISGLGRSLGGGHGSSLLYCLENSVDRGSWRATVHGVTKSRTRLRTKHSTHSAVLILETKVLTVNRQKFLTSLNILWLETQSGSSSFLRKRMANSFRKSF